MPRLSLYNGKHVRLLIQWSAKQFQVLFVEGFPSGLCVGLCVCIASIVLSWVRDWELIILTMVGEFPHHHSLEREILFVTDHQRMRENGDAGAGLADGKSSPCWCPHSRRYRVLLLLPLLLNYHENSVSDDSNNRQRKYSKELYSNNWDWKYFLEPEESTWSWTYWLALHICTVQSYLSPYMPWMLVREIST